MKGRTEDYKKDPAFAKTVWMDADIPPNVSLYSHPPLNAPEPVGDVGGSEYLHRVQRLRGGLPGGK